MGRTWSTCDWRSSSTVACTSMRLCVCSGWTLWTYSVIEMNLVVYFEWLVPYLLLNCIKHRVFLQKLCWATAVLLQHFTRYETTIVRCGGLYCYCLVYKVFLHICSNDIERPLLLISHESCEIRRKGRSRSLKLIDIVDMVILIVSTSNDCAIGLFVSNFNAVGQKWR